jgi:hypothetical protein
MILLLFAFCCCVLAVLQPALCNSAGGLSDECNRVSSVSVPLAVLSAMAAAVFAFMTGGLGRR